MIIICPNLPPYFTHLIKEMPALGSDSHLLFMLCEPFLKEVMDISTAVRAGEPQVAVTHLH